MRLLQGVAEIIVKAVSTRLRPVNDAVDGSEFFRFAGERRHFGETCEEPAPVVQRRLETVELGAATDRDRTITFDAQLLSNALKQRFGKNVDSLTPLLGRPQLRLVEDPRGVGERLARF